MRERARALRVAAAVAAVAALSLVTFGLPSNPPEISIVVEGREPGTDDPILQVKGTGLRQVKGARLEDPDGGEPGGVIGVISPSSTTVNLAMPVDTKPGRRDLVLELKNGEEVRVEVSVAAGRALPASVTGPALEPTLREDLDDAATLGGNPPTFYQDASNVDAGTLDTALYEAIEDLGSEGFLDGEGRLRTDLFSAMEDLADEGFLDGNGRLGTGHFSAFEDLVDEGYFDGAGNLRTDHFGAWADLAAEGYVQGGVLRTAQFSAWDSLFAEGKTDGAGNLSPLILDAYADLLAEGRVGSGAAQVAAGDHDHDPAYLKKSGGTLTGTLTADLRYVPGSAPAVRAITSAAGCAALKVQISEGSQTDNTFGIYGEGFPTAGAIGIHALATGTTGRTFAVKGVSSSPSVWATIYGQQVLGVAQSPSGFGAFGRGPNMGIGISAGSWSEPQHVRHALIANHTGASGDVAIFQAGTTTKARIDKSGKGYFNGGIQVGGADFAEAVKVDRTCGTCEPGDVLAVDPAARRGFRLSSEKESSLVAGVVSTRPGVVGVPGTPASTAGGIPADAAVMAIVGIVPVKVCDENGPIEAGDLLVTSSLPGRAMKAPAGPRPGTVLGKALDAHGKGLGTVEVLLRLR